MGNKLYTLYVLQLAIRTCIAIAKRHLFDSPAGGETVVVIPTTGEEIVPGTKMKEGCKRFMCYVLHCGC